MQYLIDQARVFRARLAAHGLDLSDRSPRAMFISCSDAQLVPALLTAVHPGDLFELRTYGGQIPHHDTAAPSGEARTIEYAVDELKVSDIIVCGHSRCDVASAAVRAGADVPGTGMPWPDERAAPLPETTRPDSRGSHAGGLGSSAHRNRHRREPPAHHDRSQCAAAT